MEPAKAGKATKEPGKGHKLVKSAGAGLPESKLPESVKDVQEGVRFKSVGNVDKVIRMGGDGKVALRRTDRSQGAFSVHVVFRGPSARGLLGWLESHERGGERPDPGTVQVMVAGAAKIAPQTAGKHQAVYEAQEETTAVLVLLRDVSGSVQCCCVGR